MGVSHENCSSRVNIDDVCDYVISCLSEAGEDCNTLKLQKLLYYTQAWHLAFFGQPLFEGEFEAWVHGPVNRQIYDRFSESKTLYSQIYVTDIKSKTAIDELNDPDAFHIKSVLEVYGAFSGTQLEEFTHQEKPWLDARQGCRPNQRCEEAIDESSMETFYKGRLE